MSEDEGPRHGTGASEPGASPAPDGPRAAEPVLPFHAAPTIDAPLPEGVGQKVGPYKLLQLLGEGGFGLVFLAEQSEPVKRRVALKVIKQGMDTRQVMARFEQERQALAMMDHPGIAKVLDAGATETGRPYFVMELVKGEPVTAYCDKHNLPIRERLELFAQICAAVQHAHTKGIIHRDLKPSNVLVSAQDGPPRAQVIDFGIAKATAGNLTEKTLFTEHRQLIGTPEYMSPEQAEGSLDIDTRTDVYALGVLLYELLTGSTPFDSRSLRSAAFGEILRIIREVDPPSPSTRLGESAATLVTVAARRHTEPRKLSSALRGELDWIVMKALEKDRRRRYETANGLALDIRRYLAGEPVTAAPPSAAYRVRKFVRRHKVAVTAASLVVAAMMAAVVGISWQASVARAERDKAERIAEFMADMLRGVEPSIARGRDTTILAEMMTAAAARIEKGELERAPEAELHLRGTIGNAFRELALYDEAARMLAPAVPLARRRWAGDRAETARALSDLGQLLNDQGDLDGAEPLYREALAMDRRLFPGDHPEVATDLNNLASLLDDRDDLAAAEPLAREALAMRRRLYPGDHEDVAESLNNLANVIRRLRGGDDPAASRGALPRSAGDEPAPVPGRPSPGGGGPQQPVRGAQEQRRPGGSRAVGARDARDAAAALPGRPSVRGDRPQQPGDGDPGARGSGGARGALSRVARHAPASLPAGPLEHRDRPLQPGPPAARAGRPGAGRAALPRSRRALRAHPGQELLADRQRPDAPRPPPRRATALRRGRAGAPRRGAVLRDRARRAGRPAPTVPRGPGDALRVVGEGRAGSRTRQPCRALAGQARQTPGRGGSAGQVVRARRRRRGAEPPLPQSISPVRPAPALRRPEATGAALRQG